jgi:hypothetical protein
MVERMSDQAELFKLFMDNPDSKRWSGNRGFDVTYAQPVA